jgi:6-phosphogluconolactonase (cycloisomerase 2 family)
MKYSFREVVRGTATVGLAALALLLAGCNFFVPQTNTTTTTGGGTGTTGSDFAYVSNSTSGSTFINGYGLSGGTLAAATSSPYSLNITPTAMAVSRNDGFLYVASALTINSPVSGIYAFSIGTGGALAVLNGGSAITSLNSVAAMDVSADGNWLLVASGIDNINPVTLTAYPLNTSTGLFEAATPLSYAPNALSTVSAMKIAPSGDFITVALGTGGFITFPFNTSTGVISAGTPIGFTSAAVGAYDVAIDGNNFLYVAATGNVYVFTVSTLGVPTQTPVSTIATAAGGPFSVAVDGSYLYAGANNGTSNLIYAFSTKSGVLTPLSTATIASPSTTTRLGVDSTGAYLVAQGYDSSAGLQLYSISTTTGVLTSVGTAGTADTSTTAPIPSALALTH